MKKIFHLLTSALVAYCAWRGTPGGVLTVGLAGTGNQAFDAPNTTDNTGVSAAGAVTVNADAGVITTEVLTTAAGANFTLTLTNSQLAAADRLQVTINDYAGAGIPILLRASTAAGSSVILIRNIHATDALDAALTLSFQVGKAIA